MEVQRIYVLLIEDNSADARFIREIITGGRHASKFELIHKQRLREGLQVLRESDRPVDAILLDLSLPESQGLDTFFQVRAEASDLPIVVLTGLDDEDVATRAVHEGAQDYLIKGQVDGPLISRSILYAIERKRTEKALRDRARLATAIDQTAEGILIIKTDWTVEYVNPAYESITGFSCTDVIGHKPVFLDSDQQDTHLFDLIQSAHTRGEIWRGRVTNKKKDGMLYESEMTISPVRSEQGEVINYVSVERDVTKEVILEKQLRQAQKMEAIGTVTGGVAHNFNNILSIIMGYTEIAMMAIEETVALASVKDSLEQVQRATVRARELVRQMLRFCRYGESERRPTRLDVTVVQALAALRASLPAMIDLRQDIQSESGGVLSVSLSNVAIDDPSAFKHIPPGRYVKISVSDTGHGIRHEIMDRIFDPFFTTKGPGEGTGLGLSVVYGAVGGHEGAISVSSEPGHGATFDVYLPLYQDMKQDPCNAYKCLLD